MNWCRNRNLGVELVVEHRQRGVDVGVEKLKRLQLLLEGCCGAVYVPRTDLERQPDEAVNASRRKRRIAVVLNALDGDSFACGSAVVVVDLQRRSLVKSNARKNRIGGAFVQHEHNVARLACCRVDTIRTAAFIVVCNRNGCRWITLHFNNSDSSDSSSSRLVVVVSSS